MVSDPSVTGDVTLTPQGLFAHYYVDSRVMGVYPSSFDQFGMHTIEYGNDPNVFSTTDEFCNTESLVNGANNEIKLSEPQLATGGTEVIAKQYDLVIAATGEFVQANGGTVASAMAVIVSSVNGINRIFFKDLAVTLVLSETYIFLWIHLPSPLLWTMLEVHLELNRQDIQLVIVLRLL